MYLFFAGFLLDFAEILIYSIDFHEILAPEVGGQPASPPTTNWLETSRTERTSVRSPQETNEKSLQDLVADENERMYGRLVFQDLGVYDPPKTDQIRSGTFNMKSNNQIPRTIHALIILRKLNVLEKPVKA